MYANSRNILHVALSRPLGVICPNAFGTDPHAPAPSESKRLASVPGGVFYSNDSLGRMLFSSSCAAEPQQTASLHNVHLARKLRSMAPIWLCLQASSPTTCGRYVSSPPGRGRVSLVYVRHRFVLTPHKLPPSLPSNDHLGTLTCPGSSPPKIAIQITPTIPPPLPHNGLLPRSRLLPRTSLINPLYRLLHPMSCHSTRYSTDAP